MQQNIAEHVDHDAVNKQLQILEYICDSTAAQHTQGHHNGSAGSAQVGGDGTAGTCIAFAFLYFTHLLPLPSVSLTLFGVFGVWPFCSIASRKFAYCNRRCLAGLQRTRRSCAGDTKAGTRMLSDRICRRCFQLARRSVRIERHSQRM
jgi:hypothetical protein